MKCPACSQEWTKLRPCEYLDDSKRVAFSYLCVVCAETLVSWDWLAFRKPLKGIKSYVVWKKPRISKIKIHGKVVDLDEPNSAMIIFEIGDSEIIASSPGTGRPISYKAKNSDKSFTADNVFALRSKILHDVVPF